MFDAPEGRGSCSDDDGAKLKEKAHKKPQLIKGQVVCRKISFGTKKGQVCGDFDFQSKLCYLFVCLLVGFPHIFVRLLCSGFLHIAVARSELFFECFSGLFSPSVFQLWVLLLQLRPPIRFRIRPLWSRRVSLKQEQRRTFPSVWRKKHRHSTETRRGRNGEYCFSVVSFDDG